MNLKFQSCSDEELIKLCKSGDQDAYSTLVGRYVFAVRSRASIYVNSGIDFEDLVQEGFIGLMNAVDAYDNDFGTSFSTFAFLCIDRKILDAVKKSLSKKQIPKHALVFLEDSFDIESNKSENPESVIISKENLFGLKEKIAKNLSKKEQEVLNLYLSGDSYLEIAERLSCSQKSVDNAMQRIRKKLK